jgi:sporulation protein YlmC with PRC-barrel domain
MTVLLSQLLARPVRGDSGWTHGTVHDVRAERSGGRATVTALLVGRSALRERLFGRASVNQASIRGSAAEVPWQAVESIEPALIRIKEAQ